MNETKTPDIQAMLEWLASCPLAASLNDGDVAFLASRMSYTQNVVEQAANSSFWDDFADWVETQTSAQNLPKLAGDKKAEAVVCLSPGYILNQDANTCRFQIQLQLQYYQEGR